MKNIYDNTSDREPEEEQYKGAEPLRKRGIPQKVILYTTDECKSREIIAKAMAEMYDRMTSPV